MEKTYGLVQLNTEPNHDIAYLHLQPPEEVPRGYTRRSVRVYSKQHIDGEERWEEEPFILDFDEHGRVHGIEILATKHVPKIFPLPTESVDITIVELCRQLATATHALDIETLRPYHDLSFMDPPSHHNEKATEDLWECGMCVEKFWDRADLVLGKKPAT